MKLLILRSPQQSRSGVGRLDADLIDVASVLEARVAIHNVLSRNVPAGTSYKFVFARQETLYDGSQGIVVRFDLDEEREDVQATNGLRHLNELFDAFSAMRLRLEFHQLLSGNLPPGMVYEFLAARMEILDDGSPSVVIRLGLSRKLDGFNPA